VRVLLLLAQVKGGPPIYDDDETPFPSSSQACRNGLLRHLDHLLFYGADLNSRNASGNTPLHVCAVNAKEECAKALLFRGAVPDALNHSGQTPYQVAVIAGNHELAEIIRAHRPEDVGERERLFFRRGENFFARVAARIGAATAASPHFSPLSAGLIESQPWRRDWRPLIMPLRPLATLAAGEEAVAS